MGSKEHLFFEEDKPEEGLTDEQKLIRKRKDDDLRSIINTPQGARTYLNEIREGHVYNEKIFTGNSEAFFLLGMRNVTLKKIQAIKNVLGLEDEVAVVVFLDKKSREG